MAPTPDGAGGCKFRESVLLGETEMTLSEARASILPKLEQAGFVGKNYDVLKRNCNHFSDEIGKLLLKSDKSVIPGWVNRAAKVGGTFSGLIPGRQQQGEVDVEPQQPSFSAFTGEGRRLGSKADQAKDAARQGSSRAHPVATETKTGWFSRFFGGASSTGATKSAAASNVATSTSHTATAIATKNIPSDASEMPMSEEERRNRALKAIERRRVQQEGSSASSH